MKSSKAGNERWVDDRVKAYKKKEKYLNRKHKDYQLFTKVKYNILISFLFFILLLFTKDVKFYNNSKEKSGFFMRNLSKSARANLCLATQ